MLSILLLEGLIIVAGGHSVILITVIFDRVLYHIFPNLFLKVVFELFELHWITWLMLWNVVSYGTLQFIFVFLEII